jgi:hypothetical protein
MPTLSKTDKKKYLDRALKAADKGSEKSVRVEGYLLDMSFGFNMIQ